MKKKKRLKLLKKMKNRSEKMNQREEVCHN